jgi:hypothetical protein
MVDVRLTYAARPQIWGRGYERRRPHPHVHTPRAQGPSERTRFFVWGFAPDRMRKTLEAREAKPHLKKRVNSDSYWSSFSTTPAIIPRVGGAMPAPITITFIVALRMLACGPLRLTLPLRHSLAIFPS